MALEVRRSDERSRYEIMRDGELVGIADFRDDGDQVVFPHTEIARPERGKGLGEQLVQHALDDVRSRGKTVVPACWFVAEFLDDHPDYQDLLAGSTGSPRR